MWKDKCDRTGIDKLRSTYLVVGVNQDRLINLLKNRGLTLFNVKKLPFSRFTFSISKQQDKKLFAIVKELCYTTISSINEKYKKRRAKSLNSERITLATKSQCGYDIIRTGTEGAYAPVYKLFKNVGILVGAIIFILSAWIGNDFIFGFEFIGSGNVLESQVQNYLDDKGISRFTRFSSLDLSALSREIMAQNPLLSFAQCSKRGNTLVVSLAIANEQSIPIDTTVYNLTSDKAGIVESVKVYRGRAVVSVGDSVLEGDLLVDGKVTVKEQETQTYVLAKVTLKVTEIYFFSLEDEGKEAYAEALALAQTGDKQLLDTLVSVEKVEYGYLYKVQITYRHVIKAG